MLFSPSKPKTSCFHALSLMRWVAVRKKKKVDEASVITLNLLPMKDHVCTSEVWQVKYFNEWQVWNPKSNGQSKLDTALQGRLENVYDEIM